MRRKVKRAAAMFLAALLTVNSVDLTVFTVYAKEQEEKAVVTITGFDELEESITNQQLAIGADEEEIVFPDTLDVTVSVSSSEKTGETEDKEAGESETSETETEESETSEEAANKEAESEEETGETEAEDKENDTTESDEDAKNSETEEINENDTESDEQNQSTETASLFDTFFSAFTPLTVYAAENEENAVTPSDTKLAETTENNENAKNVETKEIILTDIRWELNPAESDGDTFDSCKESDGYCYVYTPVLPETDAEGNTLVLGEDVETPMIYVLIGESEHISLTGEVVCGDFTVISEGVQGTDYSYDISEKTKILRIMTDKKITIKNTNPDVATTDWIQVTSESGANVTLAGVNINCSGGGYPAFHVINGAGEINITLEDGTTNILKGGEKCAGLQVHDSSEVVIAGSGSLNAQGGENGAGIGGGNRGSGGTITIKGGTVTATGGEYGAGIGGGNQGSGGTITIKGGTVTATGGEYGAGIGGGISGTAEKINISEGTVIAQGGYCGAGIGSGEDSTQVGTIEIKGGTVTATGGENGAGIGGGSETDGGTITIKGGTVTATGGEYGAGIGGGSYADGGTITISGGTITATSGKSGAGIGGGFRGETLSGITGGAGGTVVITGGNVKAKAVAEDLLLGEDIGHGYKSSDSGTLRDGNENNLSLYAITLCGLTEGTAVSSISGVSYSMKDVKTLDKNILYLYLPASTEVASVGVGTQSYLGKLIGTTTKSGTYHPYAVTKEGDKTINAYCGSCGETATVTLAEPDSTVYTGKAIEAKVTENLKDRIPYVVDYSATEGELTNGKPVNVGKYHASITWGGQTVSVDYEITKEEPKAADFTFTAPSDLTYNALEKPATVTTECSGMGDITLTYYKVEDNDLSPVGGIPKNAGTYQVKVRVEEGSNYQTATELTSENWRYTIGKATLTDTDFVYTPPANLTYSGTGKEAVVSLKPDIAGAGNVTVSYYKTTGENGTKEKVEGSPIDVGTYQVHIEVSEGMNYGIDTDMTSEDWKFTIQKATPTIQPVTAERNHATDKKIYDTTAMNQITLTGSVTGANDKEVTGSFSFADTVTSLSVGTAEYDIVFTPNDPNYRAVTGKVTITVVKNEVKAIHIETNPDKMAYIYGESFELKGAKVTAEYLDGTSGVDVTGTIDWDNTMLGIDQTEITLSYTENKKTVTATLSGITVDYLTEPTTILYNNDVGQQQKWYGRNDSDVVISASDYTVSDTLNGEYKDSYTLTYTKDGECKKILYFKNAAGQMTKGVEVYVKYDRTVPTFPKDGGIVIGQNKWKTFLKTITFGIFFKENVEVKVEAEDATSGIAKYWYYVDKTGRKTPMTADELAAVPFTQATDSKIDTITAENKYVYYVYVEDNAGNRSDYICSNGVVMDQTAPTTPTVAVEKTDVTADLTVTATDTGSGVDTYYLVYSTGSLNGLTAENIKDNDKDKIPAGAVWSSSLNGSFALEKLSPVTTYYYAVVVSDRAGNLSAVENGNFTTTQRQPKIVTLPVVTATYDPNGKLSDITILKGVVEGADGEELAGTWAWVTGSTVPVVNNNGYEAMFTPADAVQYESVTRTLTVNIAKAVPAIRTQPTGSAITYGQTLGDSALGGGVAYSSTENNATQVSGSFTWENTSIKPAVADSNKTPYAVVFTPTDADNYETVKTTATLAVNKKNISNAEVTRKYGSTKDTADVFDLKPYLPKDCGTVSYAVQTTGSVIADNAGEANAPSVANGVLSYTVKSGTEGATGSVTVTVTTANYENFTVTVNAVLTAYTPITITGIGFSGVTDTSAKSVLTAKAGDNGIGKYYLYYTTTSSANVTAEDIMQGAESKEAGYFSSTGSSFALNGLTKSTTYYVYAVAEDENENLGTVQMASFTTKDQAPKPPASDSGNSSGGSDSGSTGGGSSSGSPDSTGTDQGSNGAQPTPAPSQIPVQNPLLPDTGKTPVPKKPLKDLLTGDQEDKDKAPFIKGDNGKEGWDVIRTETEGTPEGGTVTVDMNGAVVVPGEVLTDIKGRDITLVFDMGNGITWSVNGKSITKDTVSNIDFGVTLGAQAGRSIPVDVINNVTGERYSMNLTLSHEGEFGFTAVLSVNMKAENAGLFANLFYYNQGTGELEFICYDEIAGDGTAELTFTHASDYTIVIDTEPMDGSAKAEPDTVQETGDGADTDASAADGADGTAVAQDEIAWNPLWFILIGAVVIVVGLGVFLVAKKKKAGADE